VVANVVHPTVGANSAPLNPLAEFQGPLRGAGGGRRKGRKETDGRDGRKTPAQTNFRLRRLYNDNFITPVKQYVINTAYRYADLLGRLARVLIMTILYDNDAERGWRRSAIWLEK